MNPPMFLYDVALSFAGEERPYVRAVAAALRQSGVRVFFDEYETAQLWGRDLYSHLADVYQNQARYVVLFISRNYAAKAWPNHERASAQARAIVAKGEYVLPARFDDTAVPGLLHTISYLDLKAHTPISFANIIVQKIALHDDGNVTEPLLAARWTFERVFDSRASDERLNVFIDGVDRGEVANGGVLAVETTKGLHLAWVSQVSTQSIFQGGLRDFIIESKRLEVDVAVNARLRCGFDSVRSWLPWSSTKLFLQRIPWNERNHV